MNIRIILLLLVLPLASLLAENIKEVEWDALIPQDYNPQGILEKYGDLNDLDDNDPRAKEVLDKIQALWDEAPVVPSLDGQKIKIPGFVVPLEGDGKKLSEFFLVPYYGACIHVPPPPANQIIYVKVPAADAEIRTAFDTVWVSGTLRVKPFNSELGDAGYQLDAEAVTPYE